MDRLGRYEIIEQLGAGAMGAVYKARDPMMGRQVAIKTILAHAIEGPQATEFRERFFREAQAAGRLTHTGIVTVYDVSEHEGTPFLVMEYIAGRTLQSILQGAERIDLDRACDLGIQLAEALDYAHKNGVIHRDIKPANILIMPDDRAKIADFGVAKLVESRVTCTGQLLGTPAFMSPEQFTGAQIDGRADIFAAGVVLYWMATGDKPFTGDTVLAVQYKVVHTDPVSPRKLNPAIPRDLEAVILKSIEKDPSERYQSGEELARDLRALRAGRPVSAATAVGHDDLTIPPTDLPALPISPSTSDSSHKKTLFVTGPAPSAPLATRDVTFTPHRSKARMFLAAVMVVIAVLGAVKMMNVWTNKTAPAHAESNAVPGPRPNVSAQPQGIIETPKDVLATTTHAAKTTPADIAEVSKTETQGIDDSQRSVSTEDLQSKPQPTREAEAIPGADESFARGNRNSIGSPMHQKELAQSPTSARLLITSPAIAEFMTVVVRVDNGFFFRRDSTTSPPPGLDELRKRSQRRDIPVVPMAEERLLSPGEHKLQVSVLLGERRMGQVQAVIGQFDPGQRRTLHIQFFPQAQRAGGKERGNNRFSVTLR